MQKQYYSEAYPQTHWAMEPFTFDQPRVVALIDYKFNAYAFYLNPTDKRMFRGIVRLINNDDMNSTFNREYTDDENEGLYKVTQFVKKALSQNFPIVQVFEAGNNSQRLVNGIVQIGHAGEPGLLHFHVVPRDDPEREYLSGIKLDGPEVGKNFDMTARTANEKGNDKKVPWTKSEDMVIIANDFKGLLTSTANDFPSLTLRTN